MRFKLAHFNPILTVIMKTIIINMQPDFSLGLFNALIGQSLNDSGCTSGGI